MISKKMKNKLKERQNSWVVASGREWRVRGNGGRWSKDASFQL